MAKRIGVSIVLIWGILLASAAVPGLAEETPDLKQQVTKLVEDLNSANREVRVQAQGSLLELGPQVLPHLPPPELLPNAFVRERVRQVRQRLEEQKARESVLASTITLEGKHSLQVLLNEISDQTGNGFNASEVPPATLSQLAEIQWEQVPFWQAVDELTTRFPIRYARSERSGQLTIEPAEQPAQPSPHVSYPGAFRLSIPSAVFRKSFVEGIDQLVRVRWELWLEPRLRPLFLNFHGDEIASTTPQGKPLPPFNPSAKLEIPLGEGGQKVTGHFDFKVPTGTAAFDSVHVEGTIKLLVAAGLEEITFPPLPETMGVARRRGGVVVQTKSMDFNNGELELGVIVSYDQGGPAFESHRTWIFHNDVSLQTKEGVRIPLNGGYETTLQADGGVGVLYRFQNLTEPPENYRFTYIAPTLLINVPLPLKFETVPVEK